MVNRNDEDHLRHASSDGRVHSGMILAPQRRYSIGEQLRRLLQMLNRRRAVEMLSRLEYLSTFGH